MRLVIYEACRMTLAAMPDGNALGSCIQVQKLQTCKPHLAELK